MFPHLNELYTSIETITGVSLVIGSRALGQKNRFNFLVYFFDLVIICQPFSSATLRWKKIQCVLTEVILLVIISNGIARTQRNVMRISPPLLPRFSSFRPADHKSSSKSPISDYIIATDK